MLSMGFESEHQIKSAEIKNESANKYFLSIFINLLNKCSRWAIRSIYVWQTIRTSVQVNTML